MYICFDCGHKYMLPVYEAHTHIFLRCPKCEKMDTKRKQLDKTQTFVAMRGKIVKSEKIIKVNVYDGVIDAK